eukprot:m.335127 g.335127  ORF g.335127 m.335127 type:complete len:522 (+) comp20523_c0_seq3:207-1772(+)
MANAVQQGVSLAQQFDCPDIKDCIECNCIDEICSSGGFCGSCREICHSIGGAQCLVAGCACLADRLDDFSGCAERAADVLWIFGSPLAFPFVFCFPKDPPPYNEAEYPNKWDHFMIHEPCQNPCECCFGYLCLPCGQYRLRSKILEGDMTKYKCCQGYYDGRYCLAAACPDRGLPFEWKSGTYGEEKTPRACLCLESTVCCLCAFHASRWLLRDDRALAMDPTEIRVERCIDFFHWVAQFCWCCGMCVWCAGCCMICLNPGSAEVENLGEASQRAGSACIRIGRIIWNGIWHVRWAAIGCMTAQMVHEMNTVSKQDAQQRLPAGGTGRAARRAAAHRNADRDNRFGTGNGNRVVTEQPRTQSYSAAVSQPTGQQQPPPGHPTPHQAGVQPHPPPSSTYFQQNPVPQQQTYAGVAGGRQPPFNPQQQQYGPQQPQYNPQQPPYNPQQPQYYPQQPPHPQPVQPWNPDAQQYNHPPPQQQQPYPTTASGAPAYTPPPSQQYPPTQGAQHYAPQAQYPYNQSLA